MPLPPEPVGQTHLDQPHLGALDARVRDGGAASAPDGMLVFGLGRGPDTTPQFRGAGIRATVGLLETGVADEADHEGVAALIRARLAAGPR